MNNADLKNLIHKQKLNFSLDQEFYVNQDIFELDVKNINSKHNSKDFFLISVHFIYYFISRTT